MSVWSTRFREWTERCGPLLRISSTLTMLTVLVLLTACQSQDAAGQPSATATPNPTPIPFARPEVEAGVAFPEWNNSAYSAKDTAWRSGMVTLKRQTGARWVSIIVDLYQDTDQSTTIHPGSGTPTTQSLSEGIAYAHKLGLKVFIEPLLNVTNAPAGQDWSGQISFDTPDQAKAWFDGYWAGYKPYVQAAQAAGADQLGIATELQALETQPASLWNTLIARERAVFSRKLVYDMNWYSLSLHTPGWLSNPALDYVGISQYMPIAQNPQALTADQIRAIWNVSILPTMDALSQRTGKPIIFTEIGYRNASDALYRPWEHSTTAPADPALQALAYTVAAQAVFSDTHIDGMFFWAWNNGVFAPSSAANDALKAQYLSPAA